MSKTRGASQIDTKLIVRIFFSPRSFSEYVRLPSVPLGRHVTTKPSNKPHTHLMAIVRIPLRRPLFIWRFVDEDRPKREKVEAFISVIGTYSIDGESRRTVVVSTRTPLRTKLSTITSHQVIKFLSSVYRDSTHLSGRGYTCSVSHITKARLGFDRGN
jgi:hypothetical protein